MESQYHNTQLNFIKWRVSFVTEKVCNSFIKWKVSFVEEKVSTTCRNCAPQTSLVKSLLGKVTAEISSFYNSVRNSTRTGMFRKVSLVEVSRNSLLKRTSDIYPTTCNITKNEHLNNCF